MEFFENSNALESLRSSDFDNLSAYAEVIDNSLQAEAKAINIQFFATEVRANYQRIEEIAYGDDGVGMDIPTLHACLKLGWSSRYNDRSGIGRFGVGMVLGAIHECQRVEVYSNSGSGWYYTYVDLEEIESGLLTEIPEPVAKIVPAKYSHLLNDSRGTLVVWSKYDRQTKGADTIIRDARHYFGRVFRYFIWDDDVEISLNNELVKAFDPLYVRTEKTNFPNDPPAKLFEPMTFDWNIPDEDHQRGTLPTSTITMRMSQLPEAFRPTQGSGGSAENKARMVHENTGISILRNKREVFYGQPPYWTKVRLAGREDDTWPFREIDRWWGCEIHFDAQLDRCFQVKNIKRGAEPLPDLKSVIKQNIGPTRQTVLDEVRRIWDEAKAEQERIDAEELGRGPHTAAEEAAKKAKLPKSKRNATISLGETAKIIDDDLQHLDDTERDKYKALFEAQPFTIREDSWKGGTFWEVLHGGGHAFISYNKSHQFFQTYYDLVEKLEVENELAKDFRALIDLLLFASAKAQAMYDTDDMPIQTFNDQWGMHLRELVKTWRENPDE